MNKGVKRLNTGYKGLAENSEDQRIIREISVNRRSKDANRGGLNTLLRHL
jgi:hypothetical protein